MRQDRGKQRFKFGVHQFQDDFAVDRTQQVGHDGKRSLGIRLVRPGSTVPLDNRHTGPIRLQRKRLSGSQRAAQVIVLKPIRFTLTHQEPSQ